ncbi:hypothetical protein AB0O03_27395 [Streptomyces diastaticus]|uniref:hypothetical protein n=1 Tax=Streptomyces diastaticus TaxID=1956 RepID=UPI00343420B5
MVTLPFAGAAMLTTAIGCAVSKARKAGPTSVYKGPVPQKTEIHSSTRGMFFARTRNDIR